MLGAFLLVLAARPSVEAPAAFLRFETGGHTAGVWGIARDDARGDWITVGLDKTARRWHGGKPAGPPLRFATGALADGWFASCAVAKGLLAVGDQDAKGPSVWLYLLAGGPVRRLRMPADPADANAATYFRTVALSADGRLAAAGTNRGTVRLWNLADGSFVDATVATGAAGKDYGVYGLAFSGSRLAYAAAANGTADPNGYLGVLDPAKGLATVAKTTLDHRVFCLDWHDPKTLAVGGLKGSVDLWRPGDAAATPLAPPTQGPIVAAIARSEDGKTTVAGLGDGTLAVFAGTAKSKTLQPVAANLQALALAPDGRTVLIGTGTGGVYETDVLGDGKPAVLSPPGPSLRELRWSEAGDALRWQADAAPVGFNLARSEPGARQQDATEDGHRLGEKGLRVEGSTVLVTGVPGWDRLNRLGVARDAVFLDETHALVATDRGLQVQERRTASPFVAAEGGTPTVLAVSPDRTKVAAGYTDGVVRIYDVGALISGGPAAVASLYVGRGEWVAWQEATGRYDSSVGGDTVFGFQVNRGETELASFVPAIAKQEEFRTPGLLAKLFGGDSTPAPPAARDLGAALAAAPTYAVLDVEGARRAGQGWEVDGAQARVHLQFQNLASGRVEVRVGHGTPRDVGLMDAERPRPGERVCLVRDLVPGPNVVQVVLDRRPLPGSEFVIVSKQPGVPADEETGRTLVLAIGIGEYAKADMKENRLGFAAPDAKAFVETVAQLASGTSKPVPTVLVDAQATRAAILKALDDLKAQAKAADRVMVFIASHGDPQPDATYITPHDYTQTDRKGTGLSWAILAEKLAAVECRSLVLFSDNCYAGKGISAVRSLQARQTQTVGMRKATADLAVFAACGADQVSIEFDDLGHGLFTYSLLKGMRGEIEGQAYDKATGVVTTDILKASLPMFMRDWQAGKVPSPQTPLILVPEVSVPITRIKKP